MKMNADVTNSISIVRIQKNYYRVMDTAKTVFTREEMTDYLTSIVPNPDEMDEFMQRLKRGYAKVSNTEDMLNIFRTCTVHKAFDDGIENLFTDKEISAMIESVNDKDGNQVHNLFVYRILLNTEKYDSLLEIDNNTWTPIARVFNNRN